MNALVVYFLARKELLAVAILNLT